MAAVTICSDFGAQKNQVWHCFVSPSISHEVMEPDAMILVFWMLSFKLTFLLSSFTFIKRLFSSSSLSAILRWNDILGCSVLRPPDNLQLCLGMWPHKKLLKWSITRLPFKSGTEPKPEWFPVCNMAMINQAILFLYEQFCYSKMLLWYDKVTEINRFIGAKQIT